MNKINVDYFHDVLCSFCYPMSFEMHKVKKQMPEINIRHRSFALVKDEKDFDFMFGSREKAKEEIVSSWTTTNKLDELKRFNMDGMRKASFPFPGSMKPLLAAKAGDIIGGDETCWAVSDKLQYSFFTESKDVGNDLVIYELIKSLDIDFQKWKKAYESEEALNLVEEDLYLATQFDVTSVPTLIINEEYRSVGFKKADILIESLEKLKKSIS